MTEDTLRELLIWGSAAGVFFSGFALGATVVVLHAKALTRKLPIPKELIPVIVDAPPPPPPLPPTASPFTPKSAKPAPTRAASAVTKEAYLTEINRLVAEAQAKRKESKLAADELPPLPARAALPSIHWNDDPHDPQEERKAK